MNDFPGKWSMHCWGANDFRNKCCLNVGSNEFYCVRTQQVFNPIVFSKRFILAPSNPTSWIINPLSSVEGEPLILSVRMTSSSMMPFLLAILFVFLGTTAAQSSSSSCDSSIYVEKIHSWNKVDVWWIHSFSFQNCYRKPTCLIIH